MKSQRSALLVGLVSLTMALAACGGGTDEPGEGAATDAAGTAETGAPGAGSGGVEIALRIGMSAAPQGAYAPYDVPFLKGMEFAAEEINGQGGIDGVTVERRVSKDNRGDQAQTITTTREVLDEGIDAFALTGADANVAQGQQNADPQPDVIFTPMFVPDSGAFLKALRAAGVTTPV